MRGQYLQAWHRECFVCANCATMLAGQKFASREDKPYCATCFGELFAKRCTACSRPITGAGGTKFISFEGNYNCSGGFVFVHFAFYPRIDKCQRRSQIFPVSLQDFDSSEVLVSFVAFILEGKAFSSHLALRTHLAIARAVCTAPATYQLYCS